MNEKLIKLTDTNPSELFGAHNRYLKLIKEHFPKLKIVARGATIKAHGEPQTLEAFENRLQLLIDYLHRYNSLDDNTVERLLTSGNEVEDREKPFTQDVIVHGVGGRLIKARTPHQRDMVRSLEKNDMLIVAGPAGTGKTYTAVAMAVKALKNKEVRRIILTRPAVEAGENLGFLPGDLKEKLDPYMQPLYDALYDMISYEKLRSYLERGIIQVAPLAFMRGRTLDDSFVILDEAQNTTHNQMKMFLTRMGSNAKFIVTGDPGQIDLPKKQVSGLKEALLALREIPGISIIRLNEKDVMRHRLVKKIITAFKSLETE